MTAAGDNRRSQAQQMPPRHQTRHTSTLAPTTKQRPANSPAVIHFRRERRQHATGEVGYVFHPKYGRRGYATEAVRAVLDVAFTRLHLHRVTARLDARNLRSQQPRCSFSRVAYQAVQTIPGGAGAEDRADGAKRRSAMRQRCAMSTASPPMCSTP